MLSENGNEFRSRVFTDTLADINVRHTRIRAGRPQTNGHVARLHRTILKRAGARPSPASSKSGFADRRRELAHYPD